MSRFWIDIENSSGTRLGAGPVSSAVYWEYSDPLSLAGRWRFAFPVSDAAAVALVQNKRIAVCYTYIEGVKTEVGAGVIDSVVFEAPDMMVVEGDDLLIELIYRSLGNLALYDETVESPDAAKWYDGGVFTDLPNAIDGNGATSEAFTLLAADSFLFIGHHKTFNRVDYDLRVANTIATDINYGFSDDRGPSTTEPLGQWRAPGVESDTTILSDAPLGQDGSVDFPRPGNWQTRTIDGESRYWLRLDPEDDMDEVQAWEIDVVIRTATTSDLSAIIAFAPGWSFAGGPYYSSTTNGTFAVFAGETVLAALVKVAEWARERFRRGPGRTIQWLRDDEPSSGVRAVWRVDTVAAEGAAEVCLITALSEEKDTYGLISRVIPGGAGNGGVGVTLADTSLSAPAGYTLSTADNYIKRDDLEAGTHPDFSGLSLRIERVVSFPEIRPADGSAARDVAASDQLFTAALNYLQQHDELHKFYRLTVSGCKTRLRPGETIRVIYRKVVDGVTLVDIDEELLILEARLRIDQSGWFTTGLDVATVDRRALNDAVLFTKKLEQATAYRAHAQGVAARSVR